MFSWTINFTHKTSSAYESTRCGRRSLVLSKHKISLSKEDNYDTEPSSLFKLC